MVSPRNKPILPASSAASAASAQHATFGSPPTGTPQAQPIPKQRFNARAAIGAGPHATPEWIASMVALGLTELEAEVYMFLLSEPGSTGYRVAQALGKPVGNIYKAIESLETKGAAMLSDDDGNRTAAATPPTEWLGAQRHAFESALAAAEQALAEVEQDEAVDEACYRLTSRAQVVGRWNAMLGRAKQFAIATLAPSLAEELAPALRAAGARVPVAVKVFAPITLKGVQVVLDPRGMGPVHNGPGSWCALTVDGGESLVFLMDVDGRELHTASWTRHPLWAWGHYTGMSSDLLLCAVRQALSAGGPVDGAAGAALRAKLESLAAFECDTSVGKVDMRRRYRSPSRKTT